MYIKWGRESMNKKYTHKCLSYLLVPTGFGLKPSSGALYFETVYISKLANA